MRILHIITMADLGGAQSVAAELARRAAERGDRVGLATSAEGPLWLGLDPRIERYPIEGLAKALSAGADIAAYRGIKDAIRSFGPDLIHLHSSKAGVLGRLAAGKLRRRVVYTVHGFDSILKAHRAFIPLERVLQYACGAIVAVSEYDRANLEANGIVRNLALVRNGARDWRVVEPSDARAAAEMRKARAAGHPVVLSVARTAPPKRLDLFLEVAAALEPDGAAFFWIGNDDRAANAALPRNVRLLGPLPDAGAYHNLADISVLFSDFEGLPMSIIEALSCGRPVVASRVGGVAEAVDGEIGEAVDNDSAAAAAALRSLLPGLPRHAAASAAARRRYEERFSLEAMDSGYTALYSRLAGA